MTPEAKAREILDAVGDHYQNRALSCTCIDKIATALRECRDEALEEAANIADKCMDYDIPRAIRAKKSGK